VGTATNFSKKKKPLKIATEDCLAHGIFICSFSVGLRANAKAGIWGVFLTMVHKS